MGDLELLLSNIKSIHQPVYVGERLVRAGTRPLAWERLAELKKFVDRPDPVILDVGSNAGFFTIQLAKAFPAGLVISVEREAHLVALQRELLRLEGLMNVAVVHATMDEDWPQRAAQACSYFDLVLLLSVLHHQPKPLGLLSILSGLTRNLVLEVPAAPYPGLGADVIEKELNAQQVLSAVPQLTKLSYRYEPGGLAVGSRDYAHAPRDWYGARCNTYSRMVRVPYIGALKLLNKVEGTALRRRSYIVSYDKHWTIKQLERQHTIVADAAVNFGDLCGLGPIWWPDRLDLIVSAIKQVDALSYFYQSVRDVAPHNLLLTPRLLRSIDNIHGGIAHSRYTDLKSIIGFIMTHTADSERTGLQR